jgi:hypothetical protein
MGDILKNILALRRQYYPPYLLIHKAFSHVLRYLLWECLKPVLVHIVVFLMKGSYRSRLNLLADMEDIGRKRMMSSTETSSGSWA